jgi:hypothetical protein
MLESVIAGTFGFSSLVANGDAAAIEHNAHELLSKLDDLAQTGGAEDAFKRALLEKAGFLVAAAQACGDDGAWLDAFKKGLREAAEMLKPVSATERAAAPASLEA